MSTPVKSRSDRIVTIDSLAQMTLLDGLLPEQLALIAEKSKLVRFSRGKTINITGAFFCFIIEGNLELISMIDNNTATGIHAGELGPGMHFGSVWSHETLKSTIIPLGTGNMAVLPSFFMRTVFNDWPELMESYARHSERKINQLVDDLLIAKAKLANTNRVLSRIERVSDMLVQGGVGGHEIPQIIQQKFLIDKLPSSASDEIDIEQGYLQPDLGIDEDRIRRIVGAGQTRYLRTRRMVSGSTRREFADTLDSLTYEELKGKMVGELVQKKRWKIPLPSSAAAIDQITVDQFSAPQKALNLMKNRFLLEISANNEDALNSIDIKKQFSVSGKVQNVTDNKEYSNKHLSI
ncbi:MAG: hypothetical protein GY761_06345 [Hyphomicrobiales bacterium]|nr:hypothetical protein [Hyphomicrobiales bacterium]